MKQSHISSTLTVIICIAALLSFFSCLTSGKKEPVTDTIQANRAKLGQYLFFDRRLSVNYVKSCGTCHNPKFAFTDGYKRSIGAFADLHQRNTSATFNLAWYKYLTQSDSTFHTAYAQMQNPLYNEHPVEMGLTGNEEKIIDRIRKDSMYKGLFAKAFPGADTAITWKNIRLAICDFMSTLISDKAPYDKYLKGDKNALTASQKNGMGLFFSEKLRCGHCHGGFNFSTPDIIDANTHDTIYYFNIGLYNIDGKGAYPEYDQGLLQLTHKAQDMGKFRVPTLRNIGFTSPYFHDGSAASLSDVIDIFSRGGMLIGQGQYAGDGRTNPYKHPYASGFSITPDEKIDLINFLYSLSDSSLTTNPSFTNPFTEDETQKRY